MISQPFSIDALKTHKLFYVLDHITETPVELYRRTPAGDDPVTEYSLFSMENGQLLVAFTNPFQYAANLCLIAKHGDTEEIVNFTAWERVVDIYNTDRENTDQGFFAFCGSQAIFDPELEWRCDNTMYGPHANFVRENGRIIPTVNKLRAYETLLPLHNVGYLIYIHLHDDVEIREKYKNNSEVPCVGLTLSEAFKLLYEWSEMTKEPFNNTEEIAVKAKQFLNQFGFTPDLVDNQVDMQVANYIKGSQNARMRPTGIVPNKPELVNFVKKRMASSSLASLCSIYPGLWDIDEVLTVEQEQLAAGVMRFKDYYKIPSDWELTENERIIEHCTLYVDPTIGPFVHNQLRLLVNKKRVLNAL